MRPRISRWTVIAILAASAGTYAGARALDSATPKPTAHASQTQAVTCAPPMHSTVAPRVITPRTDGYFWGVGEQSVIIAIHFNSDGTVSYVALRPDTPRDVIGSQFGDKGAARVPHDSTGAFAKLAVDGSTSQMTVLDYTGDTLDLFIASAYRCPNGLFNQSTIHMDFASNPTTTA